VDIRLRPLRDDEFLEAEARAEGLPVARRPYRSVGFNERAVFMSKELE
jgi:hypothetical protein